ncbi:GNAT family N-acetyltransferase [Tenggerimyces flavus]|uniref:GNAT family N-acetyltransferase n=1 Tax=Tenggerimyces flavus TaxID=1708749 RepID=A0ABV7YBY4_9ACTN|nr:GNAT family N-acetyltransferase [Tenggerimyces flavus]MBM7787160.1 GNAT superfamily N-acetyltransferase [Tenggerimyces flavus]
MPGKGRLAKTVISYGVKYGPLLYEAVKHGREPAQRALQKAFARQVDRRKALQHAGTVVGGAILRVFHNGEPIWVVFSADIPITTYPPVEAPLGTVLQHADLSQRITVNAAKPGGPKLPNFRFPNVQLPHLQLPSLPRLPMLGRKETEPDGAILAAAIEGNTAEFLLALGDAGGGETRDDTVRWTIGGSPLDYHNAVVGADLDEASADSAVRESLELLRRHDVPGTWHVGPSMLPADLGARLLAAGFAYDGAEPGMAVRLSDLVEDERSPDGLVVAPVENEADLVTWATTLARGFGEGEREATWVADMYGRLGLGTGDWVLYLATLDGEPVGTTSVFLGAGVAGVYFVMTVPEARGRGIGAAVTIAGLQQAREAGYEIGVLTSSPLGRKVYERIGFREHCTIDLYTWGPR